MYEVSHFNHMNTKVDAMCQNLDNLNTTQAETTVVSPNCKIYAVPDHIGVEFQLLVKPISEQVNYAQQGNPYSNTYNLGWGNYPNFSNKNNSPTFAANPAPFTIPPRFQGQKGAIVAPRKSSLEIMMENFLLTQI